MKYQRINWKYRLVEPLRVQTVLRPSALVQTQWITLEPSGMLTLAADYAWDGASGLAIDTRDFMRGSAVHDALYQLIKLGLLPPDERATADAELVRICKEDGMPALRRAWVWAAVRAFGGRYMNSNSESEIIEI